MAEQSNSQTEQALFDVTIKDSGATDVLKRIESRLDAIEAHHAFDRLERAIDNAAKASNTANEQLNQTQKTAPKVSNLNNQFLAMVSILQQIGGQGGASLGQLAFVLGGVAGGVAGLTNLFVQLASRAVGSIQNIVQTSIGMNQEIETAGKLFSNLFGGDEAKGEQLVKDIRQLSNQLGIATDEAIAFGKALGPDAPTVGSLKQLITLTDRFADVEGKRFGDLIFSINEAVSGDFVSIKDRFNLSRKAIDDIKALQKEYGNFDGLIKGLTQYLEKRGLGTSSIEAAAGTAQQLEKTVTGLISDFKIAAGEAPFQEWKESLEATGKFLNENQKEIYAIAYALGDAIAAGMDLANALREDVLGGADLKAVAEAASTLAGRITEASIRIQEYVDIIKDFSPVTDIITSIRDAFENALPTLDDASSKLNETADAINRTDPSALQAGFDNLGIGMNTVLNPLGTIVSLLSRMGEALHTANQLVALFKASFEGALAGIQPTLQAMVQDIVSVGQALSGDFEGAMKTHAEAQKLVEGGYFDMEAAQKAFTDSMLKSVEAMEKADQKLKDYNKTQQERKNQGSALGDEEVLPGSGGDAKNKAGELAKDLIEIRKNLANQLIQIEIDRQRREIDLEIAASRHREDIARQRARAIEDIERGVNEAVEQAYENFNKQLEQQEEDAKEARQRLKDEERDADIEAEKDYRRLLRDIQQDFLQEAIELQIRNDAIGFLQLKRKTQRELKEAEKRKNDEEKDREEAFRKQEKELEKSLKKQRQQLEENLQEQLKQIEENRQKQYEDFERSMKRQEEDYLLSLQRQEEDFQLAQQRRQEDLERSLQQQIDSLKDKYGEDVNLTVEALQAQAKEYLDTYGPGGSVDETMNEFFKRQAERLGELQAMEEAAGTTFPRPSSGSPSGSTGGGGSGSSAASNYNRPLQTFIGQGGLHSTLLSSNRVSLPDSGVSRGGGGTTVNRNSQVLEFNFNGVEPFLQRIAVNAAIEVYRNTQSVRRGGQ